MSAPFTDPIAEARQNWRAGGWSDAADAMAAVTSIFRVQQIILAQIETALRPHGLSFARFELLRLLGFSRDHRLPMSRARGVLQVHPASISSVADRLEADGLITREPDHDDGRAVVLALTPAGRELMDTTTAVLNEQVFSVLDFSADDVTALNAMLAGFRRRHGDFTDPPAPPEPW